MKIIISIMALISMLFLSGCGYKEGVISVEGKSYVYFTGYTNDIEVSIDGGGPFKVKNGKNNQYVLKPGKHLIEVFRNNSTIVKREIYLGNEVGKEIGVN
ncbi:MAG: hypothetical protein ACI9TV_001507 [Sulfurimonas sp.]|jgi:hypothetical protein|uniref:hypothetical protein n=1 Tax=Sulfurimonas sp. TaxID=2022749 RepID=UPI0039E72A17